MPKRGHTFREFVLFLFFESTLKYSHMLTDKHTEHPSLAVPVRRIHTCTLQYMSWFTAWAEDLHLSRCVYPSMPALRKIKTTDLYCAVHTDTGMHYIKPKNPSFPPACSCSASKHSLSSSIFPNLICQRLKKQRQTFGGEKSCPAEKYSKIPSQDVWNSFPVDEVAPVGAGCMWYLWLGCSKQIRIPAPELLGFNCEVKGVFYKYD